MTEKSEHNLKGRRLALFMAGVGLFWILFTEIGNQYEWTQRTRALFDLVALAGFGFGLWQGFKMWQDRKSDEG